MNKKSKQKIFIFAFLILGFGNLFANDFHSTLKLVLGQVTETAIAPDNNHIQIKYGFEIDPFVIDVGFQLSEDALSTGFDASYRFLNFSHFQLFASGFFCLEYFIGETLATDTFIGLKAKFPLGEIFSYTIEGYGGLKTSKIFAFKNLKAIKRFDIACSSALEWNIKNSTQIFIKFGSYEFFYHPFFIAPVASLGVNHNFSDKILAGAEFSVRRIDFFTISSFAEGYALRIKLEYKLN